MCSIRIRGGLEGIREGGGTTLDTGQGLVSQGALKIGKKVH